MKIYLKNGRWYAVGARFQGGHYNLYTLLMAARSAGELAA